MSGQPIPRRIFVTAELGEAKLDFNLKSAGQGPLVQANRARRAIERLEAYGTTPLTNDACSDILDDFVTACIMLKHVQDWTIEEARSKGKQPLVEALVKAHPARVVTDVCNASKHLTMNAKQEKTKTALKITANGKLSKTTQKEYVDSLRVESEGATFTATGLLRTVYADWVKLLENELGLPATWALKDEREVELMRELTETTERSLNVELGHALEFTLKVEANGRPLATVLGKPVPMPEDGDVRRAAFILLEAARSIPKSASQTEYALALDSLIVSLEAIDTSHGIGDVIEEAHKAWRAARDAAWKEKKAAASATP